MDENRWRAKRDGIQARFIAQASNDATPATEVLGDLLTVGSAEAEKLHCGHVLQSLQLILDRGTSAHEQLRIYEEMRTAGESRAAAMGAVVDWLERATVL